MSLQPDHKALMFAAAVAVLGVGVRGYRAVAGASAPKVQPALERQARAADSAARVDGEVRSGRSGGGRSGGLSGRQRGGAAGRSGNSSGSVRAKRARSAKKDSADEQQVGGRAGRKYGSGPLDRPGYIAGKLDLDVATAAQIDSLPGVSTLMARRITLDRMHRGPFVSRDGLRRVSGAGPVFLAKIDSLVVFSGTVLQPSPSDTAIPVRRRGR